MTAAHVFDNTAARVANKRESLPANKILSMRIPRKTSRPHQTKAKMQRWNEK
jgi:hypothetical protein